MNVASSTSHTKNGRAGAAVVPSQHPACASASRSLAATTAWPLTLGARGKRRSATLHAHAGGEAAAPRPWEGAPHCSVVSASATPTARPRVLRHGTAACCLLSCVSLPVCSHVEAFCPEADLVGLNQLPALLVLLTLAHDARVTRSLRLRARAADLLLLGRLCGSGRGGQGRGPCVRLAVRASHCARQAASPLHTAVTLRARQRDPRRKESLLSGRFRRAILPDACDGHSAGSLGRVPPPCWTARHAASSTWRPPCRRRGRPPPWATSSGVRWTRTGSPCWASPVRAPETGAMTSRRPTPGCTAPTLRKAAPSQGKPLSCTASPASAPCWTAESWPCPHRREW